jgi:hypothetical protein
MNMKLLKKFAAWAEGQGLSTDLSQVQFAAMSTHHAWRGYKAHDEKLPVYLSDQFTISFPRPGGVMYRHDNGGVQSSPETIMQMHKAVSDPRFGLLANIGAESLYSQLTPWEYGMKPPEPGVYMVKFIDHSLHGIAPMLVRYSYWDGLCWRKPGCYVRHCKFEPRFHRTIDAWCGLNYDPKK